MASVVTNELTPSRATKKPLTAPSSAPSRTPTTIVTATFQPCASRKATVTVDCPMIAANDRSNWPAAIGMITASASRAVIACWLAMSSTLAVRRKVFGTHSAKMRMTRAKTYRPLKRSSPSSPGQPPERRRRRAGLGVIAAVLG